MAGLGMHIVYVSVSDHLKDEDYDVRKKDTINHIGDGPLR
jgi:hypothetical protein